MVVMADIIVGLLLGLAVTVTTLVLLGEMVIVLPPGCVTVVPDAPPESVTVLTPGLEEEEVTGLLGCEVIVVTLFAGTVTTLGPIVVVNPEGPPEMIVTVLGTLDPFGVIVTTLLPLGETVTTLPPGKVVVTPLGPPRMVVTMLLPLVGHGEVIETGVAEVGLLEPTMIVTTLPFGSVVTAPVPQTVEFCGEPLLMLLEAPLLGVPITV